jgi:hypothetical protein
MMPASFCYDRRESYFANQDIEADNRFAMMRYGGMPDFGDLFDKFSRVMRPTINQRTRKWGGWSQAKPNNSKPRRKEHRV